MTAAANQTALETRIADLEARLAEATTAVDTGFSAFDQRLHSLECGLQPPPAAPVVVSAARARAGEHAQPPRDRHARSLSRLARPGMSISDVLGGQVLAWLGGVATLLGIVLFLAMAISDGWIGEDARVAIAACASALLMAGGSWLHRNRGRTEAAVVMVGVATTGLFATLIVASSVYAVLPEWLALAGGLLVGSIASTIAIRWAGRAIGAIGLMGSLLAGVMVGAPIDGATIAILAVVAACAMSVVVWRRWGWLALGTVLICAPQWAAWVLQGNSAALDLAVLSAFAALGLLGAVAAQSRSSEPGLLRTPALVMAASACIVAVVGRVALADAAGALAGNLWLAGLAGAHLGLGLRRPRRLPILAPMRHLLIAFGVTLADVAFALSAGGVVLALGWSATAVAFAWLGSRRRSDRGPEKLVELGVGVHIALALIRALIDAPPSTLAGGEPQLLSLVSVSALAAACITCGLLAGEQPAGWRTALNSLGLIAIAYLTASLLSGPALAAAWAFEGLALMRLSARGGERLARVGALAFIAGAAIHVLAAEAPPIELSRGAGDLAPAALGLAALALVGMGIGLREAIGSPWRYWPMLGAGAAILYLVSLAVVSAFDPSAGAVSNGLLELTVRQQAQVALSGLWSVAGLAALLIGLRTNVAQVRSAGLALLLATVAKVFLFDLSTLTSVYRVTSFIVLGLLLLAGAFAYQRLRPPLELHASER